MRDFTPHIDNGDLTITGEGSTTLPVWSYDDAAGLPAAPRRRQEQ